MSVVAAWLIWWLYGAAPDDAAAPEVGGTRRVTLATKDAAFRIVPPSRGGALGAVWYTPRGAVLRIQLRANGLAPRRRYRLELSVDDTVFAVTSRQADAAGGLAVDTTLHEFADGICVGDRYVAPRPLAGPHEIKFWLRADGSPVRGTLRASSARAAGGDSLPCRGNGDGDDRYVLLENAIARFVGTAPARGQGGGPPPRTP